MQDTTKVIQEAVTQAVEATGGGVSLEGGLIFGAIISVVVAIFKDDIRAFVKWRRSGGNGAKTAAAAASADRRQASAQQLRDIDNATKATETVVKSTEDLVKQMAQSTISLTGSVERMNAAVEKTNESIVKTNESIVRLEAGIDADRAAGRKTA